MYKLIKIKPTGMRITLADSTDKDSLIVSGQRLQQTYPDLRLSVVDNSGVIVWPAAA
jgi:hypothetical protein